MTEARLKANRENAKKGGRPGGSMNGYKLSLRERCCVRDEEHVRILEAIAADSTHPGFQLVAIRDLMERGWGRRKWLRAPAPAAQYRLWFSFRLPSASMMTKP